VSAVLVTLTQAKAHLRITLPPGDPGDADLQLKLDQAEAIIRNYLKTRDDPLWDASTAPPMVGAAILLMLGRLYEQRGDNEEPDEKLWQAVERMLARLRDPALA
jgi:Phage gp6-like head-tail connector protein